MRIGVFICHCGSNIGGTVDCAKVAEIARGFPDVVYADDPMYTCAEPGQAAIEAAIHEHKLDGVVVASCTPRMHEPTFRRTVERAGLNRYMFEMANIREHVSWIGKDKEANTNKAAELVLLAVEKLRNDKPLQAKSFDVTKKVLVIGAGDGGVIRELVQYSDLQHIDMVEVDPLVVEVCKKYLPKTACRLDDPRLTIHYEDGLKFIRSRQEEYDLIIVDSTDPFGPSEGLFTREFYGNCYKALKEHGVLVNQHESPFYKGDALACQRAHRNIVHSFELSRLFQAHIPTYPSGHWLFGFSSRGVHPVRDLNPDWWNSLGLETRYYNTNLHKGAFYLPNYVQKLLEKVEE